MDVLRGVGERRHPRVARAVPVRRTGADHVGPGHGTWLGGASGWAFAGDLAWDPGERRLDAHAARRTPGLTRRVRVAFALFARRTLPVLRAAAHRQRCCRKALADGAELRNDRTSDAERSYRQLRRLSRRRSNCVRGKAETRCGGNLADVTRWCRPAAASDRSGRRHTNVRP